MDWYSIDIINFILLFLLLDFFNGIHNNFIEKKLKSSILVIMVFVLVGSTVCIATSFLLVTKLFLLVIEMLIIMAVFITKMSIHKIMHYEDIEEGKEELFGNKRIMVLVPHEDDEINLMGGVMEQYVKYGSDVYVVFATNGDGDERYDMTMMGYVRMREAIDVLSFLGIPESNIIFLGYGDGWDKKRCHIYNAPQNEVISSRAGRKSTYGLNLHPAYHENKDYTYSNYCEDVKQVILDYKPDTVFCIDYDTHNEHRTLSMTFEKVIGEIIKETDYKPKVYKGYGYRTAMGSVADFYACENIGASVERPYEDDVKLYDWDNRIRLPIDVLSLSRYLKYSRLYKALYIYASQHIVESADRIINGDKVFWQRRTDSLLYRADISVSSGNKEKLTDFMLLDCDDLIHCGNKPYDGVWHPDYGDEKKEIRVSLNSEEYVDNIVLYDNPSSLDNILKAQILFDDGTCIFTGKLNHSGTVVPVKKRIKSFSIMILEFEGNNYGLTEIEAFSSPQNDNPVIYKIMDKDNNFVYDYVVSSEETVFHIYRSNNRALDYESTVVKCDNPKCSAALSKDNLIIKCPYGSKCQISLLADNILLDRVLIRNPRMFQRRFMKHWQRELNKITLKKTICHRIYRLIKK